MEKIVLLKNALDIECRSLIQKLSALYAALFGIAITSIGTWVYQPLSSMSYLIIFLFTIFLLDQHYRTKKELQEKIKMIKGLK